MFTVRTDRSRISTGPCERLLRVEITVPRPEGDRERKAVHLSLVIDRSGSMAGDKLRLALHAARQAVRSLAEGDRFSVVTFDHHVEVPVPSTGATPAARMQAEAALDTVTAGGNTDLSGGWLRGCAEVGAHLPGDAIGRCLVLTDGQANHGITDPEELTRRAREHRLRRVTTSTLGLGDGFNEFLLGRLSEEGGGNFYFAERADQIPGFVARELGEVLSVVARDASLRIEVPEGVEVESLNDYPCTREGTTFVFSLGSLAGGLALAPVFRLRVPAIAGGQGISAGICLTDQDGALPSRAERMEWSRGTDEEVRAQVAELGVTRPTAALDAARARRVALELNRNGQRSEAVARLVEAAALLRGYAGGDSEIMAQADRLVEEQDTYARPMTSLGMKGRYLRAMMAMKMGIPDEPEGPAGTRVPVLPTSVRLERSIQEAIAALHGAQGGPTLEVNHALVNASLPPGVLSAEEEGDLTLAARAQDPFAIKVIFVERPLSDGWFSHWHAADRAAVISVDGLDQLIRLPEASFVAYELLLHGLRALSASYDPKGLLHDDTRACLFDLCAKKKAEVGIKLQAGHICAACLHKLPSLGLDAAVVTRLWRAVQALAQAQIVPGS